MASLNDAARAYAASAAVRSPREQEADLFRRVGLQLRRCADQGDMARTKALTDNRRLWALVMDQLHDPANALPAPLRASIVSVGLCLQREMQKTEPDLSFLASVNETIAAGLAGAA